MAFDTQQKSEEKQPEIDNRSNDSVVRYSYSLARTGVFPLKSGESY